MTLSATHNNAKLEQYLLLAKSARGASAADLILKAVTTLSCFSELLELPCIKELKNDQNYAKYYALLELFAFGKYRDYIINANLYPALPEQALNRLRLLSIVSIAAQQRLISYDVLLSELGLNQVSQVEDLLIQGIYEGLINGEMDQSECVFYVIDCIGRDLPFDQLSSVEQDLEKWLDGAKDYSKTLQEFANSAEEYKVKAQQEDEFIKKYNEAAAKSKSKESIVETGGKMMDLDLPDNNSFADAAFVEKLQSGFKRAGKRSQASSGFGLGNSNPRS